MGHLLSVQKHKNIFAHRKLQHVRRKTRKILHVHTKTKEDIFSYISRLVEDLEKLQYLAQAAGETLRIPKFTLTWKILSAVEKFSQFRTYTEKIHQMEPTQW